MQRSYPGRELRKQLLSFAYLCASSYKMLDRMDQLGFLQRSFEHQLADLLYSMTGHWTAEFQTRIMSSFIQK